MITYWLLKLGNGSNHAIVNSRTHKVVDGKLIKIPREERNLFGMPLASFDRDKMIKLASEMSEGDFIVIAQI